MLSKRRPLRICPKREEREEKMLIKIKNKKKKELIRERKRICKLSSFKMIKLDD